MCHRSVKGFLLNSRFYSFFKKIHNIINTYILFWKTKQTPIFSVDKHGKKKKNNSNELSIIQNVSYDFHCN